MNSEKVKEIKKALETCMHTRVSSCRECPYNYTNTKTKHSECFRMAEHALTLINELENENEWLRLERDVLIGKKIVEKQKHDKAIIMKIDIQKQLKDRIAELEKKIENGTLKEVVRCKDCVYFQPEFVEMENKERRPYTKEEIKNGKFVTIEKGINCGSRCERFIYWDENQYPVWFNENDFCSYGKPKPKHR